jgi:nucleotidyltransferase/DNA polymerase involved in DNA repair
LAEASRVSVPRTILHVDMDAFYAAVEQRDRPELRGKPVVIGADPRGGRGRGVVSTASYEARRFGVGSAMPISKAYRLCPQGIYLPPDMEKYAAVSKEVMAILRRFTTVVEPLSIDEAFLDVTKSRRAFGDGETIARALKEAIRQETQLTASVGVAASKLVAKVASDMRKPDGLVVVPPGTEAAFLAPLPIRRLWGVGPKMEERLAKLGIVTIGDLAASPPEDLEFRLGTHGHDLSKLARGEDDREVLADSPEAKSLGAEHTFDQDTADPVRLRATLRDLMDTVARRLRAHGLEGRTLTLKYRDETFRTVTRAQTYDRPTNESNALFEVALKLFEGVHRGGKVRLLGVSVSHFQETRAGQLDLFSAPGPLPPSRADRLRDELHRRFGPEAATRASLLGRRERRNTSDRVPED